MPDAKFLRIFLMKKKIILESSNLLYLQTNFYVCWDNFSLSLCPFSQNQTAAILFLNPPYLTYWNLSWFSNYAINLHRIYEIPKRVVRSYCNAPVHPHSAPFPRTLTWSYSISTNLFFSQPNLCFLTLKTFSPLLFFSLPFLLGNDLHEYHTRAAFNYPTHFWRTQIRQLNILFSFKLPHCGTLCPLISLL